MQRGCNDLAAAASWLSIKLLKEGSLEGFQIEVVCQRAIIGPTLSALDIDCLQNDYSQTKKRQSQFLDPNPKLGPLAES